MVFVFTVFIILIGFLDSITTSNHGNTTSKLLLGNQLSFDILDEKQALSHSGLLLVHVTAARTGYNIDTGTVCDEDLDYHSRRMVCKSMGYDDSKGSEMPSTQFPYRYGYKVAITQLDCGYAVEDLSSCTFIRDNTCYHAQDTYIECECSGLGTYYRGGRAGCAVCPAPVRLAAPDKTHCLCPVDMYWSDEEHTCRACPRGSTSPGNTTACSCAAGWRWDTAGCAACPENATSAPGSTTCECLPGYYWNDKVECEPCKAGFYTAPGSRVCVKCGRFQTSDPGSEHCRACAPAEQAEREECAKCGEGMYGDGVQCFPCPAGSYTSKSGLFCLSLKPTAISDILIAVLGGVVGLLAAVIMLCIVPDIWFKVTRAYKARKAAKTYPKERDCETERAPLLTDR